MKRTLRVLVVAVALGLTMLGSTAAAESCGVQCTTAHPQHECGGEQC
ncbi:MAG TPA: hypothetical protein VGL06_10435 [Pseudonocardiaceae bacterium]